MKKFKPPNKKCPVCRSEARKTEALYDPKAYQGFDHWCCDRCKVGWYDRPGARGKISGDNKSLRANYVPPRVVPGRKIGR